MQDRVPGPPNGGLPIPAFAPVPRRHRVDGWTPARQRAFIAALAETGSVKWAAKRINMSSEGAYYLRRQPGADGFRAAWAAALDHGVQTLADLAIDRAREGVEVPIYWRGEQVGSRRRYNDRLLMFLLKHHMPSRYGKDLHGGTKHPDTLAREAEAEAAAREQAISVIFQRIYRLRAGFLRRIEDDPDKRAAWELLTGPADWNRIRAGGLGDDGYGAENMTSPTMVVVIAAMAGQLDRAWAANERVALAPSARGTTRAKRERDETAQPKGTR